MRNKKVITIIGILAPALAVAGAALLLNGSQAETPDSILSSNLALIDRNEVSDFSLSTNDTLLRFDAHVADLGKMKLKQKKDAVFRFMNVCAFPVVITEIVTTCGCTTPEWPKSPLMPGAQSEIKVAFVAEQDGVFFKKLFIYYAGGNAPLEIAIRGDVK